MGKATAASGATNAGQAVATREIVEETINLLEVPTVDGVPMPTFTTAGALYGRLQGRYRSWNEMAATRGWIIAHRGAGALRAPENTEAAFRIGVSYNRYGIDGGDHRLLPDGTMVVMHDRDMIRTSLASAVTGVTTNVDDLSSVAWQNVLVDAGRWWENSRTASGGFGNLPAMTTREFLSRFGRDALLTPEPKNDGIAGCGPALAQLCVDAGLQDRVCIGSFTLSDVQSALAKGIPNTIYYIAGAATPTATYIASLAGTGVRYVGLDHSQVSDLTIAAYIAAGYEVTAYTVVRQYDRARLFALGVSGIFADDPLYVEAAPEVLRTTAPWTKSGTFPAGYIPWTGTVDANRGTITGSVATGFRIRMHGTGVGDFLNLLGCFCPVAAAAGSYTITQQLVVETVPSDVTRHIDTGICFLDDRKWINIGETYSNGYNVIYRANGNFEIFKVTAGVNAKVGGTGTSATWITPVLSAGLTSGVPITALPVNALTSAVQVGHQFMLPDTGQIATVTSAAGGGATSIAVASITPSATIASGTKLFQVLTTTIAVTPSDVTLSRTDGTVASFTATDSTFRGGFIHHGRNGNAAGLIHHLGTMTIT
jgi:glycerophosphoryl diester phosphodiesterase